MSALDPGETDGFDLTVETLALIRDNWPTVADTFDRATEWDIPVLRNGREKTVVYPPQSGYGVSYGEDYGTSAFDAGAAGGYSYRLRNNDVITAEFVGRTDEIRGQEFNTDATAEVDVTIEAVNNGQTAIGGSTDWEIFKTIVRRSILTERTYPAADPDCTLVWKNVQITNEAPLPNTEDNRDHYGSELTAVFTGVETLP